MPALLSAPFLLALLLWGAPADAACYALELENLRSRQPRREATICEESEIQARRKCRRLAERRNDELPSREPVRFYCRPAN